MPHTRGKESSLLPTPLASDGSGGGQHPSKCGDHSRQLIDYAILLNDWYVPSDALLPTPKASISGPDYARVGRVESGSDDLITVVAKMANLLQTPTAADGAGSRKARGGKRSDKPLPGQAIEMSQQWGRYAAAINRWEQIIGPAPAPTEISIKGNPRLNPAFSQWMMGWPDGWVTDFINPNLRKRCPEGYISRADALRLIGNGVVSLQAELALLQLLD